MKFQYEENFLCLSNFHTFLHNFNKSTILQTEAEELAEGCMRGVKLDNREVR